MCSPTGLFGSGLVMQGMSAGLSAYGSYKQQQAQNKAAEYNARLSERQADISRMKAADARKRGERNEQEHRMQVSQLEGAQRAGFAASGVSVGSGSVIDTLADTNYFGEMDALDIRHAAQMEAWEYENQASAYTADAANQRTTKGSPGLAATTSILSSAGPLVKSYASWKENF